MVAGNFDFNSLLSRLELESMSAASGLRRLLRVAPTPHDGFALGRASLGANRAAAAAISFLGSATESAIRCAAEWHELSERVLAELRRTNTGETVDARGRSLANHQGWAMCIALANPECSTTGLMLGGLLLLMADRNERPVPTAMATSVRRDGATCGLTCEELGCLLSSEVDLEDTEWPWMAPFRRRWPAQLNALANVASAHPPPPSFTERARGQIFARAHYSGPEQKAGVPTHRHLSAGQFRFACERIARWIDDDDWRGTYAVMGALSSLTVDLIPEMPLQSAAAVVEAIHLDVAAGTLTTDLAFLSPQAATSRGRNDTIPASHVLSKPLPAPLWRRLQGRLRMRPDSSVLGDLYPEAEPIAGHMPMIPGHNEIILSWARWGRSTGAYLRMDRMDNLRASVVSGDFGNVPRSKLHYAVLSRLEIWDAVAHFYALAGLGPAVPDSETAVGFGVQVVPSEDALRQAHGYLKSRALASRPSRRDRLLSRLIEFHNHYTRLVAFELALLLALRAAQEYDLWADVDDKFDQWVALNDKAVPGPVGSLPVLLPERARRAMRTYRIHCAAMANRLRSLGGGNGAFQGWLLAMARGERVGLLCMATEGGDPLRVGSSNVFGGLPAELRVVPDAGRKWLENALRQSGLRTGDIDATLRHDVAGQSRFESNSDFVFAEWLDRTSAAIDSIAARVLGATTTGLSQR